MTEKLTSAIALDMVLRIESKQGEVADIYAEARSYEGQNNDNVIHDAIEARARLREAASDADGLIGSFDWDDEGNRIEPAPEPAWPDISERLRAELSDRPKALRLVTTIDRLFELAVSQGLPQPTRADLEALSRE